MYSLGIEDPNPQIGRGLWELGTGLGLFEKSNWIDKRMKRGLSSSSALLLGKGVVAWRSTPGRHWNTVLTSTSILGSYMQRSALFTFLHGGDSIPANLYSTEKEGEGAAGGPRCRLADVHDALGREAESEKRPGR